MTTFPSTIDSAYTPEDADDLKARMIAALGGAQTRIRLRMYTLNSPALIAALVAAKGRGVDVWVILDMTESKTPTEVAMLVRLLAGIGHDRVRIGTSPVKHRIMHLKECVVDGAGPSAVTITGSLNWTDTAFEEKNAVLFIQGNAYAAACELDFESEWQWLTLNEPAYQHLP